MAPLVFSDVAPRPLPPAAPEQAHPPAVPVQIPPEHPDVPTPTPPPTPLEVASVKVGNPDAPESSTKTWLGVSKDQGALKGARADFDQGDFKRGLPGMPSEQPSQSAPPSTPEQPINSAPPAQPQTHENANDSRADLQPPKHEAAPPTASPARDQSTPGIPDAPETYDDMKVSESATPAIPTTEDLFAATLDTARDATRVARQVLAAMQTASLAMQRELASTQSPPASRAATPPVRESTDAIQNAQTTINPTPPSPPQAAPTARSGQGGNGADRESDAFSKTTPVDVRPGQPLAGKGLAIRTVAPRWTTATRVLYQPRNAVVRIKFGRDGRVLKAAYVEGQDAGPPDVSGPLLDAVYRWSAQGDELLAIPVDQPQTGVVITFRIILN